MSLLAQTFQLSIEVVDLFDRKHQFFERALGSPILVTSSEFGPKLSLKIIEVLQFGFVADKSFLTSAFAPITNVAKVSK